MLYAKFVINTSDTQPGMNQSINISLVIVPMLKKKESRSGGCRCTRTTCCPSAHNQYCLSFGFMAKPDKANKEHCSYIIPRFKSMITPKMLFFLITFIQIHILKV